MIPSPKVCSRSFQNLRFLRYLLFKDLSSVRVRPPAGSLTPFPRNFKVPAIAG